MKDEFVTYDIAIDLHELGFDKECFGYFNIETKELITEKWNQHPNKSTWTVNAPLWQQVTDWFLEKKGIITWIKPLYYDGWSYEICFPSGKHVIAGLEETDDRKKVLEKAIIETINLIKKIKRD
jgi:hypothetical protein